MQTLSRNQKRKIIRNSAVQVFPALTKSLALDKIKKMKSEWSTVIQGDSIKAWKVILKDSNLNIYNIYVETVDNSIDAKAREVTVHFQTYDDRTISNMTIMDNGYGMTHHQTINQALDFPETEYDYDEFSIGANGYGLKGVLMRLGFVDYLITKTKDEEFWRLYKFTLVDKKDKKYEPSQVLQYSKPVHNKFLNLTYMKSDIIKFEINQYKISNQELEALTSKEFIQYQSGTYISITGMEDNGIRLDAKDWNSVRKMASIFYGQMDFRLNFKINNEEAIRIKTPKFPIDGYPSLLKDLPIFPSIKAKTSGNTYDAYFFFTLSPKHQRVEVENYDSYVLPENQWEVLDSKGNSQRSDGQYIIVFDENKRYVTNFRFKANNQFFGSHHNNMNIILLAKNKIKNLDRVKFLGFADDTEMKELQTEVQQILNDDMDNNRKYLNPNWAADKQEEISQTKKLVQNIIDDVDNYRSRYIEFIADDIESVRITTKMIKDDGNWIITNGNRHGNQIDIDQTDFKTIWEIENEEATSSKDHLEKINLWYDEIIQQKQDDVEWIIWVAKSHSFEKRLRNLVINKPCINPNFKGFKLIRWSDFRCKEDETNVRTIRVK
jgi:hypothetical protein